MRVVDLIGLFRGIRPFGLYSRMLSRSSQIRRVGPRFTLGFKPVIYPHDQRHVTLEVGFRHSQLSLAHVRVQIAHRDGPTFFHSGNTIPRNPKLEKTGKCGGLARPGKLGSHVFLPLRLRLTAPSSRHVQARNFHRNYRRCNPHISGGGALRTRRRNLRPFSARSARYGRSPSIRTSSVRPTTEKTDIHMTPWKLGGSVQFSLLVGIHQIATVTT